MDPPQVFISPISLCSDPAVLLSEPFAEQLEDISTNLCEVLLGADGGENRHRLSSLRGHLCVLEGFGSTVASGDWIKQSRG